MFLSTKSVRTLRKHPTFGIEVRIICDFLYFYLFHKFKTFLINILCMYK